MTRALLKFAGGAGALVVVLSAGNASALGTTYGATFQGTATGFDKLGLFGAPGSSLNGASYTETFLINTLVGNKHVATNQQDEWSNSTNFITASLTINNKTVTVYSSIYGEAFVNDGGNVSNNSTGIQYSAGYGGTNAYHAVYDYAAGSSTIPGGFFGALGAYADNTSSTFSGFPTGLDQSFAVPVTSNGTVGSGYLDVYSDGCVTEVEDIALKETVAAAPEPGTWALLIAGVAGLGAALRCARRRRPETLIGV